MSLPGARDALWWRRGVVYQIYPRSFMDASGDGVGDLRGVIERLDYLEWLGVDALWLSPFFPSPMVDFGYDVSDYTGVAPLFGTLDDFDQLVVEAKRRGMHIIIDYVINHSSDEHPWFVESRASRTNPRANWYVWADARPDGSPPNNWLSIFGGSAWTWDETRGQYFLHSFHVRQPDLNWREPALQAAMFDAVRFWLERGVDGIRIDAAYFAMKDPDLRDNPPAEAGAHVMHKDLGEYDRQRHIHDREHPDVHRVFRDLRALLDAHSATTPRVAIGEMHIYDWPHWAEYFGADNDEMHLPFNFGLLRTPFTAEGVAALVAAIEAATPPGAWPNWVIGNHDEPRVATRLGDEGARLAMLLLLTLRGTPTLYYGDELGMRDVPIPPERRQDKADVRGNTRDPERTPMRWDASPNAGFCPPGAEPWLPLGDDAVTRNVAVQREDPRSMLALTRALLAARRASAALEVGDFAPVACATPDVFAYERRSGSERRVMLLNVSAEPRTVDLPPSFAPGEVLISTHMDRSGPVAPGGMLLRPWEGLVLEG